MRTHVRQWGTGPAIRIPRPLATAAGLTAGAVVDMSLESGRLVIRHGGNPGPTLDELLARMTDENLHGEDDWAAPPGPSSAEFLLVDTETFLESYSASDEGLYDDLVVPNP
jgi:antitoxin MazE